LISDFNSTYSKEHGIKMNLIGFDAFPPLKDQIEFINIIDKNAQQKISPDEVLSILEKGNHRFMNGVTNEKYLKHQAKATVIGQNPIAIVLSCIDSRTTTEHIFDLGLGDIFSVRIAGNVLNEDILGSMEFAVHEIGVKLVLVLGHTKCSAVAGACNHVQLDNLTHLLEKINPAIEVEKSFTENRNGSNYQFVNAVAKEHVLLTLEKIREESKIIREAESKGIIKLCAAMYELESGKVHFL
jgi:carbonic anhydrase